MPWQFAQAPSNVWFMEAIIFGIGAIALAGYALVAAADSRPRIEDTHTQRREAWFPRP